ncbi:MAG TPA: c-type cytochrome [Vicinamibacterales bacterium]|jgi:mono/diheme cytochrome c family protein
MRQWRAPAIASLVALCSILVSAQQPQAPAGGGRGRIGGNGIGAYPVRAAGDPAAIERGRVTFSANCAFCHGADARGGDGGPSLLRSSVVLDDQNGELIGPVVQSGRTDRGMPKFGMTNDQIADIATFLHTFRINGYDPSRKRPESILVGDARAGEKYFNETCASCHSASGDLKGFASKMPDPRTLQQGWLMPGSTAGRGGPPPGSPKPPRAAVTLANGQTIEGELERADDFVVALRTADGTRRTIRVTEGVKVQIRDPLQPHRDLLRKYRDADIHDVTAYLVTLK